MEVAGLVVGVALPAAQALYKFIILVQKMYDVPDDVKIFVRLLNRLDMDYRYASVCWQSNLTRIVRMEPQHGIWIASVLSSAAVALDALNPHLPNFLKEVATEVGNPKMLGQDQKLPESVATWDRFKMVLNVFPQLQKHQTVLLTCHTSLMSGIAFLQSIETFAEVAGPEANDAQEDINPFSLMGGWAPPANSPASSTLALAKQVNDEAGLAPETNQ